MDKQRTLKIDKEFFTLIPPLTGEERDQLERNLIADGCRDPLVVWGDILVDGHNRYDICQRHSIPWEPAQKEFANREEAKEWIILNQLGRRNVDIAQRVILAEKYRPILEKKAKERQRAAGGDRKSAKRKSVQSNWTKPITTSHTDVELAKIAKVGLGTIKRGRVALRNATEEEIQALKDGDTTISKLYEVTRDRARPEEPQQETRTETRVCKRCKQEKALTEFRAGKTWCDACLADTPSRAQEERELQALADAMFTNPEHERTPDDSLWIFAANLDTHTEHVMSMSDEIDGEKSTPEKKEIALASIGRMENALAIIKEKLQKGISHHE